MLAHASGVYFFFISINEWNIYQILSYGFVILCAIEALNWGVVHAFEKYAQNTRIEPGGQALYDRTIKDYAFIVINKLFTVGFAYHLSHYIYYSKTMPKTLAELSILNTVPALFALFILYDLTYSLFHRFLHVRSVYGYIHKHHHRQAAPIQGHDDAVNTHPFEFVCGEYNHLLAIAVVPCHMYTAIAFVAIGGILASLSHTRFDITMKLGKIMFYSVKEHDTHHKMLTGNYGQYTQVWDRVFGTFYEWTAPREGQTFPTPPEIVGPATTTKRTTLSGGGPNRPAPFAPSMCKPTSTQALRTKVLQNCDAPETCAVTQAASPLGQSLIRQLVARGAKRIVAIDLAFPSTYAAVEKVSANSNLTLDQAKAQFEALLASERTRARMRSVSSADSETTVRVTDTVVEGGHAVIVEPVTASSSKPSRASESKASSQGPSPSSSPSAAADDVFSLSGVELLILDISDKSEKTQLALQAVLKGVDTIYHLLPKYIYDQALATGTFQDKIITIEDKLAGSKYSPIKLPTTGVVSEAAKAVAALSRSAAAAKAHARANHPALRFATGTLNLVFAARASQVKSFVFASSTAARVEGNLNVESMDEAGLLKLTGDDKIEKPISIKALEGQEPSYSKAVRAAEMHVRANHIPGVFETCVVAAAGGLYSPEAECPTALAKALDARVRAPAATSLVGALASTSRLFNDRIACGGSNIASYTHLDNLVHALILAGHKPESKQSKPQQQQQQQQQQQLTGRSEAGEYYIVSDGDAQYVWDLMEKARLALGLESIWARYHIYYHVLAPLTTIATCIAKLPVLQHLAKGWPTMDTLNALTFHRYFSIDKAVTELGYAPVRSFDVEFPAALEAAQKRWFHATGMIPPSSSSAKAKAN